MRFAPTVFDPRLTSSLESRCDAICATIPDQIPHALLRLTPDETGSPLKSTLPAFPASQLIKVPKLRAL